MKRIRLYGGLAVIVLGLPLAATLTACGTANTTTSTHATTSTSPHAATSTPTNTAPIEIATDLPLSGGEVSVGMPDQDAVQLAVDDANSKNLVPGHKIVLAPMDDVGAGGGADPATGAANVARAVANALVAGVIGPAAGDVALSAAPVASRAPLALISPSAADDCLTTSGSATCSTSATSPSSPTTFFRLTTTNQVQGSSLADFGFQQKGYRSVFVIDDTSSDGQNLAADFRAEWRRLGGTVSGTQSAAPTASYVSLLTAIAARKPDLIFFAGGTASGGLALAPQMRQVPGLAHTPLMGADGINTSDFARTVTPLGGTAFCSAGVSDETTSASARAFVTEYGARFGANNIGAYSAASYDATMILIAAIEQALKAHVAPPANATDAAAASAFRKAVISAVRHETYSGATGVQSFGPNGDTTVHDVSIYTLASNPQQGDGWTLVTQLTK